MGIEDRVKRGLRAVTGLPGDPPPPRVRDAKGKVLEIGDEVLVVSPITEYRVAGIRPILAPGAPPSAMEVILVTKLHLVAARDSAIESLYQLRHAAEMNDGLFPGQGEPTSPLVGDEPKV